MSNSYVHLIVNTFDWPFMSPSGHGKGVACRRAKAFRLVPQTILYFSLHLT
jgi:hypothetical protein